MFFYFFSIRFYGGMICCAYILQVLPFRTAFTLLYIRNRSIMNCAPTLAEVWFAMAFDTAKYLYKYCFSLTCVTH